MTGVEAARAYRARRKAEGRPIDYRRSRATVDAICAGCGSSFQTSADRVAYGRGKFCSVRCRNVANNRARATPKPPRKSEFRKRAERIAVKAAAGTSGGVVFAQGPCAVCGGSFTAKRFNDLPRYCSKRCASRGSRDWIDPRVRYAIYQRDKWACQLCRRETHRWAGEYDPLSATLDHIVPRSKGGSGDPSNLRLLCSACNSKRGDLTYFTDADLAA